MVIQYNADQYACYFTWNWYKFHQSDIIELAGLTRVTVTTFMGYGVGVPLVGGLHRYLDCVWWCDLQNVATVSKPQLKLKFLYAVFTLRGLHSRW